MLPEFSGISSSSSRLSRQHSLLASAQHAFTPLQYGGLLKGASSVSSLSVGVQCNPQDAELRTSSETCLTIGDVSNNPRGPQQQDEIDGYQNERMYNRQHNTKLHHYSDPDFRQINELDANRHHIQQHYHNHLQHSHHPPHNQEKQLQVKYGSKMRPCTNSGTELQHLLPDIHRHRKSFGRRNYYHYHSSSLGRHHRHNLQKSCNPADPPWLQHRYNPSRLSPTVTSPPLAPPAAARRYGSIRVSECSFIEHHQNQSGAQDGDISPRLSSPNSEDTSGNLLLEHQHIRTEIQDGNGDQRSRRTMKYTSPGFHHHHHHHHHQHAKKYQSSDPYYDSNDDGVLDGSPSPTLDLSSSTPPPSTLHPHLFSSSSSKDFKIQCNGPRSLANGGNQSSDDVDSQHGIIPPPQKFTDFQNKMSQGW